MILSYMMPQGVMVIEDRVVQMMTPGGGIVSLSIVEDIFPAQYSVPTAVALVGVRP